MASSCMIPPNCTFPSNDNDTILFEGDPDVAGIGVIIAFLISSWLAFACVTLSSLAGFIARFKPDWNLGIIPLEVYQKLVLALSDSQLFAGTAVILAGFIRRCTITQYHFSVSVWLAEISFTTHQSSFTILDDYFSARSTVSYLRILWVTAFTACTIVGLITESSNLFLVPGAYGMIVQCTWDSFSDGYDSSNLVYACLFPIFTVWGYLEILSCLAHVDPIEYLPKFIRTLLWAIEVASWLVYNSLAKTSLSMMDKASRVSEPVWKRCLWGAYCLISFAYFVLILSIKRLAPSRAFNLIRIVVFLLYGTIYVFQLRENATDNGLISDEDEWGFGQQVALLLLGLPTLAFLDAYSEAREKRKRPLKQDCPAISSETQIQTSLQPDKLYHFHEATKLEEILLKNHVFRVWEYGLLIGIGLAITLSGLQFGIVF